MGTHLIKTTQSWWQQGIDLNDLLVVAVAVAVAIADNMAWQQLWWPLRFCLTAIFLLKDIHHGLILPRFSFTVALFLKDDCLLVIVV